MSKFFKQTKFILLMIFLFALALRVSNLENIPNGLHSDEVHAGYQGYKIIKTGSDIFGNKMPLYIDKFGDYRPAGIFYVVGIFTSFFGLNNFTIRFPVTFLGSLTIFSLYFLVTSLTNNKKIALLSSFLLAISPWHIVASRATSESLICLFLVVSGITSLLYGVQRGKAKFFLASFFLLISSYFFYHVPRLFIPIFISFFTVTVIKFRPLDFKVILKKRYLQILLLMIMIISLGITFTKFGTGRFNQTSIFANKDVRTKIKALEDGDSGNIVTARIFHNKPLVFSKEFLEQYISYFSVEYLYVRGGLPDRYVVNDVGLFYYIELPLLLVGLFFLITRREKFFFVPILWFLLGPIAAALTLEDSPNIQRSIFVLPAFLMIEAYGLYFLLEGLDKKKKYLTVIAMLIFLVTNSAYFFHQYFVHSPAHVSYARNDGNDKLFAYLDAQEKKYDKIYLPVYGDLPIYYYYFKPDKATLLSISRAEYENGFEAGKYIFVSDQCPDRKVMPEKARERILIVQDGNCKSDKIKDPLAIYRKDSTVAYFIGDFSQR